MPHTKKLCQEDLRNRKHLLEIAHDGRFRVAIFWSARIQPEDRIYQEVAMLAEKLAKSNYDIVTGGGPGVMEAASKGHSRASKTCLKGQSIGINIELPHEQAPNQYLDFTQTANTFSARLDTFMLLSDVFVVAGGGIGTLLELFYTWQLMQVGSVCRSPIILWGKGYGTLKDFLRKEALEKGFMSESDYDLTLQVQTMDQVLQLVNMAHQNYEHAGKDACVNINRYISGARQLGLA